MATARIAMILRARMLTTLVAGPGDEAADDIAWRSCRGGVKGGGYGGSMPQYLSDISTLAEAEARAAKKARKHYAAECLQT